MFKLTDWVNINKNGKVLTGYIYAIADTNVTIRVALPTDYHYKYESCHASELKYIPNENMENDIRLMIDHALDMNMKDLFMEYTDLLIKLNDK